MPTPWMTRNAISMPIDWDRPDSAEPMTNTTMAACTSSFLLYRSASLPQIGVVAVAASRDAVITQVYWDWVPSSLEVIVGSALETIVELRRPTNSASSRPLSASRVSRLVIGPSVDAGGAARWVVLMDVLRSECRAGCRAGSGVVRGRGVGGGQQAIAQPGQAGEQVLGGTGLPAVGDRGDQPQPPAVPVAQARLAGGREREQAGASVPGVGTAGDQAEGLRGGHGAADHRGVQAELAGERAHAQLPVLGPRTPCGDHRGRCVVRRRAAHVG